MNLPTRRVGTLRVGFREVEVVQVGCGALKDIALEKRVACLQALVLARKSVLTHCAPEDLLTEDGSESGSETRRVIMSALNQTGSGGGVEDGGREFPFFGAMSAMADSVENCVILYSDGVFQLGEIDVPGDTRMGILPAEYYDFMVQQGSIAVAKYSGRRRSVDWKRRRLVTEELPDRHRTDNDAWPSTDYSRCCELGEARRALATALGMAGDFDSIRRSRMFGQGIGDAVGLEQSKGWLATDLKIEHFISHGETKVVHVDHGDDIFLLRYPTAEEMAMCIAPLYQHLVV